MERYSKKYDSKWQSQYSEEFKKFVCNEFLTGSSTRRAIEKKYKIGNSRITYWLKEFGYVIKKSTYIPSLHMPQPPGSNSKTGSQSRLEKELEEARLLAEMYRRIIEKAEDELKINIKKKSSTK